MRHPAHMLGHPLTRKRKVRTLARYGGLQLRSRVSTSTVVPWIEETKLTLEDWTGRWADVAVGPFK
jgi:hypothetical protein